ncbi:CPBP family intramembrane glutamic endopeptidase [Pelotomaculum propionicicum]|uniref:CPBP family intramembrane glutamic endopeptidase n=1 Tax=Pelotomaculum propionicicum TaxID=258475 RepID=UPI003B7EEA96
MSDSSRGIAQIIRQRPLVAFFIFSIAFTWLGVYLMVGLLGLDDYTFGLIAGFGPTISAIIISAAMNNKRSEFRRGVWLCTFFLVLVIAGFVRWISRIWWNHNLDWNVLPGDFLLVSLAAFVIASAFSSNEGMRSLLRPYLNWRVPLIWIIIAIGLWPAITLAGNFIGESLGLSSPAMPLRPDVPLYLTIPVSFVWALFFNGSLGEEAGWRGFALPRLQQRFSPLVASLILGFFWGAFHWIFFFVNLRSESWYMFWVRLGDIPLAILFTWLYNRTKGKSLLPVLLLHASMNATLDYLPRIKLTVYAVLGVVVLIVILKDRMWRKINEF